MYKIQIQQKTLWNIKFLFYNNRWMILQLKGLIQLSQFIKMTHPLRKHAYSNILKISPPKRWKFSDKISDIFFHISAQNIDYGYSLGPPRRGGSNENPQSMVWAEIWKVMYTPVNPSFTI